MDELKYINIDDVKRIVKEYATTEDEVLKEKLNNKLFDLSMKEYWGRITEQFVDVRDIALGDEAEFKLP